MLWRSSIVRSLARLFVGSRIDKSSRRVLRKLGVNRTSGNRPKQLQPAFSKVGPIPPTVVGTVRISLFAGPQDRCSRLDESRSALKHCHTWVKGPGYQSVEDNDIRGFMDGRYVAAWNQPRQIHVRLGRKQIAWAKHGDHELFRVLQRWSGLWLPAEANVTAARLVLDIENGVDRDLEVLLYAVHKDWDPGEGGLLHNNNSAPAAGEVWWNEVSHGTETWGLPGASFASDTHPRADTPVAPLAMALYQPGAASISFESSELAAYIERRVASDKPLLFLLKLADYLEDIPGTSIDIYSCNHGDDRNTARRPRLIVNWECAVESARHERHIILEHGRTMILPRIDGGENVGFAVSFESEYKQELPEISIRSGGEEPDWVPAKYPQASKGSWVEVRLEACVNPLPFGSAFIAEIQDTWVTTGPPEEQEVKWTFVSPSGRQYTSLAEYRGDSRWRIYFVPKEFGRWNYQWFQNLTKKPYESAIGTFDVVPGDRDNSLQALDWLIEQMNASELPPGRQRARAFSVAFNRLQRFLLRHETPESFPLSDTHKDGGKAGARLDEARKAFGGTHAQNPRLAIDYPEGVTLE